MNENYFNYKVTCDRCGKSELIKLDYVIFIQNENFVSVLGHVLCSNCFQQFQKLLEEFLKGGKNAAD